MPDDYSEAKYPDGALAKALRQAVKALSWTDPVRRRITWQRALELAAQRGASTFDRPAPLSAYRDNPTRQRVLDNAVWVLTSALDMGTMAADYREHLSRCAAFFTPPRHRRPPHDKEPRELTAKQLEALEIVREYSGSFADAARRLGIDRKSLKERFDAANKKMGIRFKSKKAKTGKIARDRRGQEAVASDDDGPAPAVMFPGRPVQRDRRRG